MINIVGGIVAIGLGSVLIKSSFDYTNNTLDQVEKFKDLGKIRKEDWRKVTGEVVELGLNVDFPEIYKNWPKKESFEDEDSFSEALKSANEDVYNSSMIRSVYGGVLIRYRFTDREGATITSRTIGLLPDRKKDVQMALNLKVGSPISVYYRKDDPTISILRKTTDQSFKKYFNSLLGPSFGQFASGMVVFSLGLASFVPGLVG